MSEQSQCAVEMTPAFVPPTKIDRGISHATFPPNARRISCRHRSTATKRSGRTELQLDSQPLLDLRNGQVPFSGTPVSIMALGATFILSCVAVYQWIDRVDWIPG